MKYSPFSCLIFALMAFNSLVISSCQNHKQPERMLQNHPISFPYSINSLQDSLIGMDDLHLDLLLAKAFSDTAPNKDTTINRHQLNINCSIQVLETKGTKKKTVQAKNLVFICQTDSLEDAQELENLMVRLDSENRWLVYDNHKCTVIKDNINNSQESVECIFTFFLKPSLSPATNFRILTKTNETQQGSENGTTETHKPTISESLSENLGLSESTTLILLALIGVVILLTITVCIWKKKKKKRALKNQSDRQKLVFKNSLTPVGSVPELTSPTAKLNLQPKHQIFSTDPNDPNTGMSPVHSLKSVPHLRLEEDGMNSNSHRPEGLNEPEGPDDIMFTNIDDSPDSVSEGSSRISTKNPPNGLDFNIEFSMAEHGSIIKNNLAKRTYTED